MSEDPVVIAGQTVEPGERRRIQVPLGKRVRS